MRVSSMKIELPGCVMTSTMEPPSLPTVLFGQMNNALNSNCRKFKLYLLDTLFEKYSGLIIYSGQEFSFYMDDKIYFKDNNLEKILELIQNM